MGSHEVACDIIVRPPEGSIHDASDQGVKSPNSAEMRNLVQVTALSFTTRRLRRPERMLPFPLSPMASNREKDRNDESAARSSRNGSQASLQARGITFELSSKASIRSPNLAHASRFSAA